LRFRRSVNGPLRVGLPDQTIYFGLKGARKQSALKLRSHFSEVVANYRELNGDPKFAWVANE
jgi:hypothetical protein